VRLRALGWLPRSTHTPRPATAASHATPTGEPRREGGRALRAEAEGQGAHKQAIQLHVTIEGHPLIIIIIGGGSSSIRLLHDEQLRLRLRRQHAA
jgi:hypothetical protein